MMQEEGQAQGKLPTMIFMKAGNFVHSYSKYLEQCLALSMCLINTVEWICNLPLLVTRISGLSMEALLITTVIPWARF